MYSFFILKVMAGDPIQIRAMTVQQVNKISPVVLTQFENENYPGIALVPGEGAKYLHAKHHIPMTWAKLRCLRWLEMEGVDRKKRNMYLNDEVC